jgi:diacylglycerol kinase family enzyme
VASAAAVLIGAAGARGLVLLLVVLAHYAVVAAAAWLFVSRRGAVRWAAATVAVVAVLAVPLLEAAAGLLWVAGSCVALLTVALLAARAALRPETTRPMREVPAAPPRHPFLIMNARSGGGKVERFDLAHRAEELGADVTVLDGRETVGVASLAHAAVARGADLLGVAAGDGTQALVAGVAADCDVPLLVIPAGTRNHFALDLGLDRNDPGGALEGLAHGVEVRVDLGDVNGRPFVNNVSFGAYAEAVARPDYRDDKLRVTLDVLPGALSSDRAEQLVVRTGDRESRATAVLVSNNPYATADVVSAGRRSRLDEGVLGVVTARVANARDAARLLAGRRGGTVATDTATSVVVTGDGGGCLPVAIDGESVELAAPVRCGIRPGALRVRLPHDRPGVSAPAEPISLGRLVQLARPVASSRRTSS